MGAGVRNEDSKPDFHPAVAGWLADTFEAPTPCQQQAWPAIAAGRHTLVAAPTGAGKTLAAFLSALDELVHQSYLGTLADETQVVYISPLKALGNDIEKNLRIPLAGIAERLPDCVVRDTPIRVGVRTGDTPPALRNAMKRRPPHVLVTTPESLYVLLTSASGRDMLRTTRTVIVDEIHALASNKRGAHLALSLERLATLTPRPPQRIGLSATQRPIERIARFLTGAGEETCDVIDLGHRREIDLKIELPPTPLEAVLSADGAGEQFDRIAELIGQHRTTLVFVNTRRMAERVARALSDRIGEDAVTSHHGSMAKERRLDAEQRLKAGALRALVATASLELGIDVGDVDLVCQLGSTRTLSMFLQRVGRSGHAIGAVARGRLFPQTRDELVECVALLDMVRRGELDTLVVPDGPLDVLAQQLVAEVSAQPWALDPLFALVTRADPYRELTRERFDQVVAMLGAGFSFAHGRRAAYLHLDAINGRVSGRRGARLTAMTCGGAIPDNADYDVIAEPGGQLVGTVNEDFAIDSLPGNVFQLGNTSWRVLRVEASALRVADAAGEPPNMPFWFGEAPARSAEVSAAVSRLRTGFAERYDRAGESNRRAEVEHWLAHDSGAGPDAARQLFDYLASGYRALGAMPSQDTLVMERFFDESGGMQLVIHSPFGARINRAWGLALRKRFCRTFNFELQAAAIEDAIVISLGAVHSFPLDDVWRFLDPASVRDVLTQALLDAPMFNVRWRWVVTCALAVLRFRSGAKVHPRLQRMAAEDLSGLVFPDQLACAENLTGKREIPDHPLVQQAILDCLTEAMDIDGLEALLRSIRADERRLVARDLTEPSPFAQEVLNSNPYAFLDDAPLEERRTQAVRSRRWLDPETASDLGALDLAAIERAVEEVTPRADGPDELHDCLLLQGALAQAELEALAAGSRDWLALLERDGRVRSLDSGTTRLWLAAERHAELAPAWDPRAEAGLDAARQLVRGRLENSGPCSEQELAHALALDPAVVTQAAVALEAEGIILRGSFRPGAGVQEWCDRRVLARIHRYTLGRLRAEIEPVPSGDFMRFLIGWQYAGAAERLEGPRAVREVLRQLAGFETAAAAWEQSVLPLRIRDFEPAHLDALVSGGRAAWIRLGPAATSGERDARALRVTPIALLPRSELKSWLSFNGRLDDPLAHVSALANEVYRRLDAAGACFFDDLCDRLDQPAATVEAALGELAAHGLVTADSFAALRILLRPAARRRAAYDARPRAAVVTLEDAGRWDRVVRSEGVTRELLEPESAALQELVRTLLRRYGVVFRRIIERETALPAWRYLLWALRRMEARGEVRGGRFVAGFSGEQFALPEAVEALRRVRREPDSDAITVVSAADPLNLVGVIVPGMRLPALAGNLLAYHGGEPVAMTVGGQARFLKPLATDLETRVRTAMLERDRRPRARPRSSGRFLHA